MSESKKTLTIEEFEAMNSQEEDSPLAQKKSLSLDEFENLQAVESSVKSDDGDERFALENRTFKTMAKLFSVGPGGAGLVVGEDETTRKVADNVRESFKRGDDSATLSQMKHQAMLGKLDRVSDVKPMVDAYNERVAADPIKGKNAMSNAVYSVANMLPALGRGGLKGFATGTLAAAGVSVIPGGQAVAPQAFGVGQAYGSWEYWYRQGSGDLYYDLAEAGVEDNVAKPVAMIAGGMYAGVEFSQLYKMIPGSDKFLKKVVTDSVTKTIANLTKRYGANWAAEVGEEGLQEIINSLATDIGTNIGGATNKAAGDIIGKALSRSVKTMAESAIPMMLLLGGSATIDTKNAVKQSRALAKANEATGKELVIEEGELKDLAEVVMPEDVAGEPSIDVDGSEAARLDAEEQGDVSFDFSENLADDVIPQKKPAKEKGPKAAEAQISRIEEKLEAIQDREQKQEFAKESLSRIQEVIKSFARRISLKKSTSFEKATLDNIPKRFRSNAEGAISLDEALEEAQQAGLVSFDANEEVLIDFLAELPVQESKLKAEISSLKAETETKRIDTNLKQRIKDIRSGIRTGAVMAREEVGVVQKEMETLINQSNLSLADKKKFIPAIRKVKTQRQLENTLNKVIDRIIRLEELSAVKRTTAKIKKELERTKPSKRSGKKVGRFTAEIQEMLDKMSEASKLSAAEAQERVIKNLEKYGENELPPPEVVAENSILEIAGGLSSMDSKQLKEFLAAIQDVKAGGRTLTAIKAQERKEYIQENVEAAVDEITGGKGLDKTAGAKPSSDKDKVRDVAQVLKKFVDGSVFAWNDYLNILTGKTKTKPGQSRLERFANVFEEAQNEKAGRSDNNRRLNEMVMESYGLNEKDAIKRLKANTVAENLGVFENAKGDTFELVINKDQAIKKYMELQDPTLQETFFSEDGEMLWTEEIAAAVIGFLDANDVKFAEAQLAFYQEYYPAANEVYKELYGVNLAFNEFYSPIRREGIGGKGMNGFGEMIQESVIRRSVTAKSVKVRTANLKKLKFTGASSVLVNHIEEMERFKAWALKIRDLQAVFGNDGVKQAITAEYGSGMYSAIGDYLDDFARGGVHRSKRNAELDSLRIAFTQANIVAKPSIFVKQLVSTAAYLEHVSPKEWASGLIEFWKNPIKNSAILNESKFARTRGEHIDRDLKDAVNSDEYAAFRTNPNLLNTLALNVKYGDKLAILMGGWTVYKKVLNETGSKEEALKQFAQISNSAQQSSDLAEQNAWQRAGSFGKLFSMFMSAPNQYLRRELGAIRNYANGRISAKQAAKTVLVYHFILPMLFQMISDLGWEPDKQKRAAILGSLNGFFVVGDMLEAIVGKALGIQENYMTKGSPLLTVFDDFRKTLTSMDLSDLTNEDFANVIVFGPASLVASDNIKTKEKQATIKAGLATAGNLSGYPLKSISGMLKSFADFYEGNYAKGFAGLMGWPESVVKNIGKKKSRITL